MYYEVLDSLLLVSWQNAPQRYKRVKNYLISLEFLYYCTSVT